MTDNELPRNKARNINTKINRDGAISGELTLVPAAPQLNDTDGILVINKPDKLTSHDVVLKIRHKTKQRKVGHAGTLDPSATGVLILVLGRATKLVSKLITQDKEYEVTMRLGIKTNTGDITGKTIEQHEVGPVDQKTLEQICG